MSSFAAQLGQKALAAQISRREWVQNALLAFEKECENAAGFGKCSAEMFLRRSPEMNKMAMELLKEKLGERGFKSFETKRSWKRNLVIKAKWALATEVEKTDTATAPQGVRGNCPICHEHRHLVALVPCGHGVCKQCNDSAELRRCPMCRKKITGATEALFIGWAA